MNPGTLRGAVSSGWIRLSWWYTGAPGGTVPDEWLRYCLSAPGYDLAVTPVR